MNIVQTKLSDFPPKFQIFISYFFKALSARSSDSDNKKLILFVKNLGYLLDIKD